MLQMDEQYKISFLFDNKRDENEESIEKELINSAPVIVECPLCDGKIHQTELSFICSNNKRVSSNDCNFRITRKILDKEVPVEELKNLVSEKKTGLIKGFISRKTKRRFEANLILKKNGSIGFEFPPRKKKTA